MGAFGVVVALCAVAAAGLLLSLVARRLSRRWGADPDGREAQGGPVGTRGPNERA